MAIPVLSTFQELAISYTLSSPLAFQMAISVSTIITLQRQRNEGILALSLANRIRLPSTPTLSITLSDGLRGGIREHITHVWVAHPPEKTVIASFYNPSVACKAKAYKMLRSLQGNCIPQCLGLYATVIPEQDGRTVYVLLLELVAGNRPQYLCKAEDVEDKDLADYLCEKHRDSIFATMFRLALDFVSRGVFYADWAPRNVITRPLPRQGSFRRDGYCPTRFEINADDVMVDFERIARRLV
ncbi:uncharacterized protein ARMOST_12064 [Armillaria ostoyae]|uniref:Protein kinase domain-containing protein n=1 Tax=Armillaria ostoyae TaxID=47428 RepID=A0A284RIX7_ARMOS|nr:uncharacterized protein ARMOST_12064 [Armillaria ostoyae]